MRILVLCGLSAYIMLEFRLQTIERILVKEVFIRLNTEGIGHVAGVATGMVRAVL